VRAKRGALLVAAVLLVIGFSVGPLPVPDLPGVWEYLPHTIAYAVLTGVVLAATPPHRSLRAEAFRSIVVAIVVIALGVGMEALQRVFDRDVELADIVANTIGVTLAVAVHLVVRAGRNSFGRGRARVDARASR
jgi:VanZ family protein